MADVLQTGVVFPVTLNGTVTKGDLIGHNGTGFVAADADSVQHASAVALAAGVSGDVIMATSEALVQTTGLTANQSVYLHTTAGAITPTRPTTDAGLRQPVGYAISTTLARVSMKITERAVPLITTGATSAYAVLDSGDFGGPTLDAQNETLSLISVVPENAVSLVIAKLYLAAEATGGTPTMDITVSSAIDGAQWDAVVADATLVNQVREGAAADEMQVTDVTTGFDATNIIRPGAILGVKCLQDDAGTDISFVFGGVLIYKVAE